MRKRQNEAALEPADIRAIKYRALRAPLPAIREIHAGRSWGGSAVCSEDGQQRLQTPGTRAYELMWQISNEG